LPYGAKILGREKRLPPPAPDETFVPDVTGLPRDRVISLCGQYGLKLQFAGIGDVALRQSVRAGRSAKPGSAITVYTEERQTELSPGPEKMPQLLGMPLRLAVEKLLTRGVRIRVVGSGTVTRQDPEGGSEIKKNSTCVLEAG
jgi:stage V sporulation protein D (sporulation-specific penicillin-binding protein)